MRVIPAIDLKDGQCVRLQKGDYGTAHKVAENPVETAQRFLDAGADLVHMVDLDAAKDGSHANYGVVEQVIRETGASVELGGGIRSMQDVETVLALGVSRVIIGSAAVRDPEFVAEAVRKVRRQDRCRHRRQERDRPHGRLAGRQRRELHRVRRAHGVHRRAPHHLHRH